jgi:hypothetical protein
MQRIISTIFIAMMAHVALSQSPNAGAEVVVQLLESLSEDGVPVDENEDIQTLLFLADNPINLNQASREALESLFFLTDVQIENLLYYIYAHGPMLTLYELQGVEGFSVKTIQRMLPFVSVNPIDKAKPTRGIVLALAQMPMERARGYDAGGAYMGSNQRLFARTVVEMPSLRVGAAVEKDAGEPMFGNGIPTVDHSSAFVELYPTRIATKWVIGDYRLSFGHGLALSTGITMGKSAAPTSIRLRQKTLHGYASADEVRFLRGSAAEIPIGKMVVLYPFASYKQVDGTLASDTNSVTGWSTSGLHRTATELERRQNMAQSLVGGAAKLAFNRVAFYVGGYNYALDLPLSTNGQLYQTFNAVSNQVNYGFASYTAMLPKTIVSGEFAMMEGGQSAVSQLVTWEPDGRFSLSVRYQRFSVGYMAPYMAPGSRYNDASGETNVYAGFQIRHNRKLESNAYTFLYKSKWLRYLVDAPSEGFEGMWRTHFSPSKSFMHYAQVKWRHTQKNRPTTSLPDFGLEKQHLYNFRWDGRYAPSTQWRFSTRAEMSHFSTETGASSTGVYLHQEVGYKSADGKWAFDARYGIFNTDDYNSRVYVYEPDVRYAFSVPALSGQGTRAVLVARWSPLRQWDVYARWSRIHYADRTQVGSGYSTINSDARNELKFQVIYNFYVKPKVKKPIEPEDDID